MEKALGDVEAAVGGARAVPHWEIRKSKNYCRRRMPGIKGKALVLPVVGSPSKSSENHFQSDQALTVIFVDAAWGLGAESPASIDAVCVPTQPFYLLLCDLFTINGL